MKRSLSIIVCTALAVSLCAFAQAQQPAGWSAVKGKILYEGEVPKQKPVKVDKDVAHCLGKGPILSEEWVVDPKTKGVRDVFVWLMPEKEGSKMPIHPKLQAIAKKDVVMDQPNCRFVPHALAMREGQRLIVKNTSPITHNFRYQGHPFTNAAGNLNIVQNGQVVLDKFVADYKLPVIINCDIHKWMSATIRVFDHPYFAVTKEDGSFEFPNAPAGKYRLFIWHRSLGYRGGEKGREGEIITIRPEGVTDVGTFEITKPKE